MSNVSYTLTCSPQYIADWGEYAAVCPFTGTTYSGEDAATVRGMLQQSADLWAKNNISGKEMRYPVERNFVVNVRGRILEAR